MQIQRMINMLAYYALEREPKEQSVEHSFKSKKV